MLYIIIFINKFIILVKDKDKKKKRMYSESKFDVIDQHRISRIIDSFTS